MTALLPAERLEKLVKVCGLFASSHDGERAAAALQASRIIKAAGLSWADLLKRPSASIPLYCAGSPPRRPDTAWFDDARLAQRHAPELTLWERQFIAKIAFLITLSPKQAATLAGIAATLRARGLR